jgi:hypothetical protein
VERNQSEVAPRPISGSRVAGRSAAVAAQAGVATEQQLVIRVEIEAAAPDGGREDILSLKRR